LAAVALVLTLAELHTSATRSVTAFFEGNSARSLAF
jgi:hypothetical protein